jgi:hypothetical protein
MGLETMRAIDVLGLGCGPSSLAAGRSTQANFPVLEWRSAMPAFDDHMFHRLILSANPGAFDSDEVELVTTV